MATHPLTQEEVESIVLDFADNPRRALGVFEDQGVLPIACYSRGMLRALGFKSFLAFLMMKLGEGRCRELQILEHTAVDKPRTGVAGAAVISS